MSNQLVSFVNLKTNGATKIWHHKLFDWTCKKAASTFNFTHTTVSFLIAKCGFALITIF